MTQEKAKRLPSGLLVYAPRTIVKPLPFNTIHAHTGIQGLHTPFTEAFCDFSRGRSPIRPLSPFFGPLLYGLTQRAHQG